MLSCAARDNPRTRRPISVIATTTSGTLRNASAISLGLVTAIMTAEPMASRMLRNVKEAEEPTTICTSVVSALRRDSNSPVRVRSKNSGDNPIT